MIHEPRGFLRDFQIAGDLVTADAVLAVHNEPHSAEPFIEADRRILENRSNLERKLAARMRVGATPDASARHISDLFGLTIRALHLVVRPANFDHEFLAVLEIAEINDRALKRFRRRVTVAAKTLSPKLGQLYT